MDRVMRLVSILVVFAAVFGTFAYYGLVHDVTTVYTDHGDDGGGDPGGDDPGVAPG